MDSGKFLRVWYCQTVIRYSSFVYKHFYSTYFLVVLGILINTRQYHDSFVLEQTRQKIPQSIDDVYLLCLLHIDRTYWKPLADHGIVYFVVDISTFPRYYYNVVVWNIIDIVDTSHRTVSYEVSIRTMFDS